MSKKSLVLIVPIGGLLLVGYQMYVQWNEDASGITRPTQSGTWPTGIVVGTLLGLFLAFCAGLWTYNDAKRRGMRGAGMWGVGVVAVLIVAMPLYLAIRHPLPEALPPAASNCPHCGKFHSATAAFCPHCGKSLTLT
jgi:hypothetical protein